MVPHSHYYPVILHRSGDSDVVGNGADAGAERVVAKPCGIHSEQSRASWRIGLGLSCMISPAHLMNGDYDGWLRTAARTLSPSERIDQARETHAHAHDRDLAHKVIDSVARNQRLSGGVAWTGRYDKRVDLQQREKVRGNEIAANDGHVGGQKRDLLVHKFQVTQSS